MQAVVSLSSDSSHFSSDCTHLDECSRGSLLWRGAWGMCPQGGDVGAERAEGARGQSQEERVNKPGAL